MRSWSTRRRASVTYQRYAALLDWYKAPITVEVAEEYRAVARLHRWSSVLW